MRSRNQKIWAVLLLALVLTALAAGSVYAYLSNQAGPATTPMNPAVDADPQISAPAGSGDVITTNLKVTAPDKGYAVYIRAAIVVTWKSSTGVYGTAPVEGTDYALNWNSAGWFQGEDGFFYHFGMVESGEDTTVLIHSLNEKADSNKPDGYVLNVEIIVQTVQALGTVDGGTTPAVTNAWGIAVSNGQLVDPNP